ncbi:type VI secretion system-associated protein TagO [Paracoccus sulfuroxidans]|uniref:Type VI secretion system protein VasI n=1 Tax=Paracoccus sulfuroxidans TaxID=384678 RepID=A0A562NC65_9RHOB|nr:type VI secretion system-associated protein TagO [Paracoccus sulfuroxidans]TWI29714.1 type VI secretion system protein VasI [Paracoccus sulfuroxidans]
MCKAVLTAGFLIAAAGTAAAQEECVKITDPDDRLNCFDQSYRASETVETESEWKVEIDKSKLDDTTQVTMALESNEPVRKRFGGSEKGSLLIRCKENTTALYILWAGNFMADLQGRGRVDYRVDDRAAKRVNMDESTDNMALGLWNGGKSIPFIKDMYGASSLYVRATPFSESPVEMTFNVSGIEEASKPLREACGW